MKVAINQFCTNLRRRIQAFSLIESVIGLGICGIVVVAMYSALTSAFNVVRLSQENLRATQILIEKIEICRLYSWEQLTDPHFFPKHFDIAGYPEFTGTMSIKKGPNDVDYKDDMKTVTVEVRWGGKNKDKKSREFVTYITRNGLQSYLF